MGAMTIAAVIFDMDGTLTDSEHWWDEVRRQVAADEGIASAPLTEPVQQVFDEMWQPVYPELILS